LENANRGRITLRINVGWAKFCAHVGLASPIPGGGKRKRVFETNGSALLVETVFSGTSSAASVGAAPGQKNRVCIQAPNRNSDFDLMLGGGKRRAVAQL